jgi:CO dehydrogenase maturation factor
MRVAFTGKGGSGKSTLAALFVGQLRAYGQRVLAIDADINVHLPDLLGAEVPEQLALSRPENVAGIRGHLLGSNTAIGGVDRFIKSTPPGPGSRLVLLADDDPVIARYTVAAGPGLRVATVGTYERQDIGASCYHGSLAILENLLSHAQVGAGEWIVCDMVAGTDAFSNTLHTQFDLVVVAVEPTPEAVGVARRYLDLARAAGIDDVIAFVGNKITDGPDAAYLESALGVPLLGHLPLLTALRRARQQGRVPDPATVAETKVFADLRVRAESSPMTPARRLALLGDIHRRLADKEWVRLAYGDVTGQLTTAAER